MEGAMRVFELMTKRVETISPDATVADAAAQMRRKRIRHVVVVDGSRVVGVVSDRDVRTPALHGESVTEVMGEPPIVVRPNDTVRTAANRMRRHFVSSLPVLEGGRLIGIVTAGDLLKLLGRGVDRTRPAARAALHHRVEHKRRGGAKEQAGIQLPYGKSVERPRRIVTGGLETIGS
jgi:acetoin utilization protein AcuB